METLTHNVYNYGCTGIFEKHKLLFSFQITIKLEMDQGNICQEELDFFIKVCGSIRLKWAKTFQVALSKFHQNLSDCS